MSKRKKQTRKSIFGDKFATPTVVVPEKKPETKQDDGFAISEGMKYLFGITQEDKKKGT